jgi:Tol biopolymer transport system component
MRTILGVAVVAACSGRAPPEPEVIAEPPAVTAIELPARAVVLHEAGIENAYPRLSGDGATILYQSDRTGRWQLWLLDVASGQSRRLTNDEFDDNFPDWSPDGQWVAFVSNRDGNEEVYRIRTDGSGLERLTDDAARDLHPYFAPDGRSLLFNSTRGNGTLDLYRLSLDDRQLVRLTDTLQEDSCARYSPDQRSIVFLRNDLTMDDVMILDVASGRITSPTSTPNTMDGWPTWSPDGRWLYYSTTASGAHSIHRVRPDGTGDQALTAAVPGEEHARAFVSADGQTLVLNERRPDGIDITMLAIPP